jgi:hypothetical protein
VETEIVRTKWGYIEVELHDVYGETIREPQVPPRPDLEVLQ